MGAPRTTAGVHHPIQSRLKRLCCLARGQVDPLGLDGHRQVRIATRPLEAAIRRPIWMDGLRCAVGEARQEEGRMLKEIEARLTRYRTEQDDGADLGAWTEDGLTHRLTSASHPMSGLNACDMDCHV